MPVGNTIILDPGAGPVGAAGLAKPNGVEAFKLAILQILESGSLGGDDLYKRVCAEMKRDSRDETNLLAYLEARVRLRDGKLIHDVSTPIWGLMDHGY